MTRAIALILSCLACAAWAAPLHAETIRVAGTGALDAMRLAGEAFQKIHPQTNVAIVRGLGSRGGIRALQAGAVDVAVGAAPAPAAEAGLISVELGRMPIILYLMTRGQSAVAVQPYLGFRASPAGHELLTGLGLQVSPGPMTALRGAR